MFPTINKRKTGINLRKIMDINNITVKDVQEYLGLGSVQSVYHWLNGVSIPSVDNLYALSELFQVPMDSLICGNRQAVSMNVPLMMPTCNHQRMQIYYSKINHIFHLTKNA